MGCILHNELALSDTSCPFTQGYNYQQGGELHFIQQLLKLFLKLSTCFTNRLAEAHLHLVFIVWFQLWT